MIDCETNYTKNARMDIKSEKTEKKLENWGILLMKRVQIKCTLNLGPLINMKIY